MGCVCNKEWSFKYYFLFFFAKVRDLIIKYIKFKFKLVGLEPFLLHMYAYFMIIIWFNCRNLLAYHQKWSYERILWTFPDIFYPPKSENKMQNKKIRNLDTKYEVVMRNWLRHLWNLKSFVTGFVVNNFWLHSSCFLYDFR